MSGIYVTADPRFIEKGRIWRVVGPESQENFVLGTIHVDSKLIHDATPEFNQIFTNVSSILLDKNEVPVNSRTMLTAYKDNQNNNKIATNPAEPKRQALRFINAPT
jgi:uncharacterized protein YbaP (TraB family)